MAYNNFQPKWTTDIKGNPQTTVWMEAKTDKKGNAYWVGSLQMSNGKRLGFIVNGKTISRERNGKDITLTPLKVTVLKKIDAPAIGL